MTVERTSIRPEAPASAAGALTLLRDRFERAKLGLPGARLPWLARAREEQLARFEALGFPSPRLESWHYTNIASLAKAPPGPAEGRSDGIDSRALAPYRLAGSVHVLVFVAGRLRPDLSRLGRLPAGAELSGLGACLDERPDALEGALGDAGRAGGRALVWLNGAMTADGAVLRLAAGVSLDDPVQLLFVAPPDGPPVGSHPRVLVIAGPDSRLTLLESYVGWGRTGHWTNAVTEVTLGRGAAVEHVKLQGESTAACHLATGLVRLDDGARYRSVVAQTGGHIARHEIEARLDGEGIHCRLGGVYLGRGRQHIDNTTVIDHLKPRSTSEEHYRGVLDDSARGVFQGRIVVRPEAQKTDAHQLNENLLLSAEAEIDTKPELEILADDVKCGHGANAGALDEDALFYLRARGLGSEAARSLLIEGFVAEAIEAIEAAPVREHARRLVLDWLPAAGRKEAA